MTTICAIAGYPDKIPLRYLTGAYHGETCRRAVGGDVALFRDAYEPLPGAGFPVPSPDWVAPKPGEIPLDDAKRATRRSSRRCATRHREDRPLIIERRSSAANAREMTPEYSATGAALCDQ